MLAAVGKGWFDTVDQAAGKVIQAKPVATPSSAAEVYDTAHARFADLYPALAPAFHATD